MIELLLLFIVGGFSPLGVIVGARYIAARQWQASLVAYKLRFPATLSVDDVTRWLAHVQATTHAPKYALLSLPPVALETVATTQGVTTYLLVAESAKAKALAGLRGSLPGVRLEEMPPAFARQRPIFRVAAELTMTNHARPLAVERSDSTATNLLAALQPLSQDTEIHLRWIGVSAGTPSPVRSPAAGRHEGVSLLEEGLIRDAEEVRAARLKQADPLLHAVVRVGVVSNSVSTAYALLGRVWSVFHMLNAPGVRLVPRRNCTSGLSRHSDVGQ